MLRLLQVFKHADVTAKVYRDTDWMEYRVKFYKNNKHRPAADYQTNCEEDAVGTAKFSIGWVDPAIQINAAFAAAKVEAALQRTERTIKLLAHVKGHRTEFAQLHGILCMGHSFSGADSLLIESCFDGLAIATRLDEMNAIALRGAA